MSNPQNLRIQLANLLAPFESVDWDDVDACSQVVEPIMKGLSKEGDLLARLVESVLEDEALLGASDHEILYGMTKFVLYDDPLSRFRLRYNSFMPGTPPEWSHSHRATFSSTILSGSYRQYVYNFVDVSGLEVPNFSELHPILEHEVRVGAQYTMHHSATHALVVSSLEPCVSLMVRGPVVKPRSVVIDLPERIARSAPGGANNQSAQVATGIPKFRRIHRRDVVTAAALLRSL